MLHRETVVISDIRGEERIPQEGSRPTFVHSLVMVPMLGREPLGAIGAYWSRPVRPSPAVVAQLEHLAGLAAMRCDAFRERCPIRGRIAQTSSRAPDIVSVGGTAVAISA